MSSLSWNCQGFGLPWNVRFLEDLVQQERPVFIFLCETLSRKDKMEFIRCKLGFEGLFVVEPRGRSGGLEMLWKEQDQAKVLSFSHHHIDIEAKVEGFGVWRLTVVYGEPNRSERRKTWDLLRNLARDSNLPWSMIGDFNNVVAQKDKKGGDPYPRWLVEGFNEALTDAGLIDMEIIGHQFTWEKSRGKPDWMEVRLDRAVTTESWLSLFPMARLYNLEGTTSDHSPIILIPKKQNDRRVYSKFRFENAWLLDPMCYQLVYESWNGSGGEDLQQKLKRCSEKLGRWGKEVTSNFSGNIKMCKEELKRCRSSRDPQAVQKYEEAKQRLHMLLEQREIYWRQRSKQLWLQAGDKNSRFFHASATTRRRTNHIHKLKNSEGEWRDWDDGLQEVITDYYMSLFTSSQSDWAEVVDCVPQTITREQNDYLLREIQDQEVKQAIFQMHPDKSPGPDGMTPAFYQKHWAIVGKDLTAMVKDFFKNGLLPQNLNETNVVLIPKKKSPTEMGDLRPISLCNVLVKVITKVMENRMKDFLKDIVSETQSAFVPGRLISDNIMIAYEVMHYLKRKRRGKEGDMAVKLDMSKAYDRIEWGYLQAILRKMGFAEWWIHLILKCVTSVSYSIIHGSREMGPIFPSRGIRQGDPLSPYLFILCAEGLSALMHKYEREKWMHGVKICRKDPVINHMLFADDCYVYCKANEDEASKLLEMLDKFEKATGQRVNTAKSSVFFSTNNIGYNRERICEVLNMVEADERSKYLGLPSILGRNKTALLGYLRDKVTKRVNSWDRRWISKGERRC